MGFEDRLDEFLVLLRARLGWGFRSLLSFKDSQLGSNRAVDAANALANANAANARDTDANRGVGSGFGRLGSVLDGMSTSRSALFKPGAALWRYCITQTKRINSSLCSQLVLASYRVRVAPFFSSFMIAL